MPASSPISSRPPTTSACARPNGASAWRQPVPGTVHLVAAEGGAVLAIASGGPPLRDEVIVEGDTDDYTAQVYGLYVDAGRYGGGIGRRLLGALAARLAGLRAISNLCLWAFELNPFRRFYDRLGGQAARAKAEWDGGGQPPSTRWPMAGPTSAT